MINSNVTQIERVKKTRQIKQKTVVVFSKAFSVIDVISAVTFTKSALIYIALSPNGFESSTINGFPTTTTKQKNECLLSFCVCVAVGLGFSLIK